MTDRQLFNEVFDRLNISCWSKLSMKGTMVCWDGEIKFNTDGYNLGYNLFRLTNLLNNKGIFE